MVWVDSAARLLVRPAELPIGVITYSIGGPFSLWLMKRRRGFSGSG